MNKKVLIFSFVICLLVTACGPGVAVVPTIDSNSIINTAQAAAFTMVAQTQAAIPTNTPTETPTQTPLPTDTPLPLPTVDTAISQPTATSSGAITSSDPCWHPLAADAPGNPAVIRIKNKTKGLITVTLYLWQKTVFGECGYRVYDIYKGESVTIYDAPTGNYAVTAWVNNRTATSYGTAIISDNHLIDFEVYVDFVKVIYP
jgi:hypothetical protein